MYAIKGSWVGQTFALAKGNDYEGRKSRIRRSKEERKEMVESFIKNYQISSNGSFPSLNLTHKEVGGSFYTVREIVREIIQENRVLGPAKLIPEEQNSDLITEQYRLRSISSDLQIPVIAPSSENDSGSNHLNLNDDLMLNSDGLYTEQKSQKLVNGQTLNGSNECERNNEGDELIGEKMQVIDISEAEKFIEEKLETPLSQVFDNVIVETFPVRPVSKPTNGLFGSSDDAKNETLTEETGHQKASSAFSGSSTVNCSSFVDEMEIANAEGLLVEIDSGSWNEISTATLGDQVLKGQNLSSVNDDVKYDTASNGKLTNVNGTKSSRRKELSYIEASAKETIVDVQPSSGTQKASKPTLDRINLESWEVASNQHTYGETNPVFAILKAFVAALVKFWSE